MRTLLVLLLAVVAGCGVGDSVWSSSVSELVMHRSGGFVAAAEPTEGCPVHSVEFTLVVADRSLSAWRCAPGSTAPPTLMRTTASRTLSAAEFDALVPKLEALRVVNVDTCGADKPIFTVTVTTPSGTTEYGDSFYSCNNDGRPTIDSDALDAAAHAFSQLAFPQS